MEINAITLAVVDMAAALRFHADTLGLPVAYGGADSEFTTLELDSTFLNLFAHHEPIKFWGRFIVHVADPDQLHETIVSAVASGDLPESCTPHAAPADAPWGERYFHVNDPDGHEISFARRL